MNIYDHRKKLERERTKGVPYRGVSLYCYAEELGFTMTLEDCLADMYDMGATGLEILANGHIENYPNPGEEWLENWFFLLEKYDIEPVEYGHWVDSRMIPEKQLSTKQSYEMLVRDITLASKLGFTVMRTKLGVVDEILNPVPNWREFIEMALPVAEEHNVRMCPELHQPTALKSAMVDDYVEFIEKTGTKHFGLNIDLGVFQTADRLEIPGYDDKPCQPEDMVDLLPYTYACHAKFTHMTEDLEDPTHPYKEILAVMIREQWDGCLLSEYEGKNKDVPGYSSDQLRKQHVMMRKLLGEID
ncbi:TIM barrel protein [Parahaliea maris]|uniref:TIM barrel protein n=1 Tax=Parahaliea maris TaxID=2716870 RepID=A0A5C8ZTU4_9GAMM|nr:TIM barrel protein [Parahaliea maris]TXS91876.1 TIM barrel protein [Parahaliea maris]